MGASNNLIWRSGSIIFEKGSPSDALYIVLSGRVRIFDTEEGEEVDVAEVLPGNSFAERSLLLFTTHSKSAQAAEDAEVMVIPKESFQEVLSSYPEVAEHFRRRLAQALP